MSTCPCCGQEVSPCALLVNLDGNQVSFAGEIVRLWPQTAAFVFALQRDYPRSVSDDRLSVAVWGAGADYSLASLRVTAYHARQALKSLGVVIDRAQGGYRLVLPAGQ